MRPRFIHELGREARGWPRSYLARRPLLLALLFYVAVLLLLSHTLWWRRPNSADPVRWAGQRVSLTGVVAAPPDLTPRGGNLLVQAETIRLDTETFSVQGRVRVQVARADPDFAAPGDRVMVRGRLSEPSPARVPGTFDFEDYLSARGIHSVLYAGAASFHDLGESGRNRALRFGWRLNQIVVEVFNRRLPPEEAAILSGLVAGRRPRFQAEVKRAFTESGTMHVLVASGSNVAFVAGLWYLLARFLFRFPRRAALVSSLPAVWSYAFLAGLDAPILRAALMATWGFSAHALAREDRPIHALGAAALAMLIMNPRLISDIGFQMSFLTVTGFILTLPALSSLLPSAWRWRRAAVLMAATALTAELWLLPITMAIFKRIYPLGPLANLMVVPLSEGGLLAGLTLFMVDRLAAWHPFFEQTANATAVGVSVYARTLLQIAQFFADHPGRVIWTAAPPVTLTAGIYLCCLSMMRLKNSAWAKLIAAIGVFLVVISLVIKPTAPQINDLQATWIDVGRGLGVLIQTPEGRQALVLSSPVPDAEIWERSLMPYLAERRVRRLDLVVLPGLLPPTEINRINPWISVGHWIQGAPPQLWRNGDLSLETVAPMDSYTHDPPVIVRSSSTVILLTKGLGLATQEGLVNKKLRRVAMMQGSFSARTKWREDFVRTIRPCGVVETGFNSESRPSCPPWENVQLAVPQKTGIFTTSGADCGGKN